MARRIGMVPQSLAAARLRAVETLQPYTGAAIFALVPVEVPGMQTLAVDQYYRLYYDPAILSEWSNEELAWVVLHEVWHCLMGHSSRAQAAGVSPETRDIWNLAADATVNPMLLEQNAQLPGDPVTPKKLDLPDNGTVETYYQELLKRCQRSGGDGTGSGKDKGRGDGRGGGGARNGNGSPSQGDGSSGSDPSSSPSGLSGGDDEGPAKPGSGRCGSSATGIADWWEDGPPPNKGSRSDSETAPGLDEAEKELVRREVARQIKEASTMRGTVPGGMVRWAEEVLTPPQVDWRTLLSSSLRAALADVAGQVDFSYRRPSRRQSTMRNVVLPAMRRPVPQIAIVVDTSGSMSDKALGYALTEIRGVLAATGQRDGVSVLACDAASGSAQRVFDTRHINLSGGGGTDMRVGIDDAMELRPRPNVIVVATDGYTPWPAVPIPGVQILACILDGDSASVPDFIRTVEVDTHA